MVLTSEKACSNPSRGEVGLSHNQRSTTRTSTFWFVAQSVRANFSQMRGTRIRRPSVQKHRPAPSELHLRETHKHSSHRLAESLSMKVHHCCWSSSPSLCLTVFEHIASLRGWSTIKQNYSNSWHFLRLQYQSLSMKQPCTQRYSPHLKANSGQSHDLILPSSHVRHFCERCVVDQRARLHPHSVKCPHRRESERSGG